MCTFSSKHENVTFHCFLVVVYLQMALAKHWSCTGTISFLGRYGMWRRLASWWWLRILACFWYNLCLRMRLYTCIITGRKGLMMLILVSHSSALWLCCECIVNSVGNRPLSVRTALHPSASKWTHLASSRRHFVSCIKLDVETFCFSVPLRW